MNAFNPAQRPFDKVSCWKAATTCSSSAVKSTALRPPSR
ncbi:hypothetical protein HDA36_001080 [Nocardiopsis composta]|uniref:Uncharacterized protein n=1 Tax=Nocardiopsis composta TaxID=157465 RepID=A0A7W8QIH7_9ACTN|nr:hypothetical protein [Nocardiopsis composta]